MTSSRAADSGLIPATILFYTAMVLFAMVLGWWSGVGFPSWKADSQVIGLAVVSAVLTCGFSRLLGRTGIFDTLIAELGEFLRGLSRGQILVLALFSAVGEEWLFRGVLQPWIGIIWATTFFGGLHFPYRRGLWPWTVFALLVGAWMGWLRWISGSVLPPTLFHAIVNAGNLSWILSIPEKE